MYVLQLTGVKERQRIGLNILLEWSVMLLLFPCHREMPGEADVAIVARIAVADRSSAHRHNRAGSSRVLCVG